MVSLFVFGNIQAKRVVPLIDKKSQNAIRRKIVWEKVRKRYFHGLFYSRNNYLCCVAKLPITLQGIRQEGKKICVLHELGNKTQLGAWG